MAGALLLGGTAFSQGQYSLLHNFTGGANDGARPQGSLTLSGSTLYGMTFCGGLSDTGTIFKINTDGTGFVVLHSFAGGTADGRGPNGSLTLSGTVLYGMTCTGGTYDLGTVFKMNTDGTGFTVLHSFAGSPVLYAIVGPDGSNPYGSLTLSGTTLYGMTWFGDGAADRFGIIFQISTDGTGFIILHTFAGGTLDGASPHSSLTLSGSTLFGMTPLGGSPNLGTVFRMNADGTGFTILHSFVGGSYGANPYGALTLSGSTLFGMTANGGNYAYASGTVFRMNTDGTSFTVLKAFPGGTSDGANPFGGALTLSGSTLFGMTSSGGGYGSGTIFTLTGYAVLHAFGAPGDGASPYGDLTPSESGSTLYGMTSAGGSNGLGVIFALTPNGPLVTTQPSGQTVMADNSANFTVAANAASTYHWQRLPAGSTTWIDLTDGANYSGTSTATLTVSPVTAVMNGDSFQCVISNSYGNVTSSRASLTVISTPSVVPGWPQVTTSGSSWVIRTVTFKVYFYAAPHGLNFRWEGSGDGGVTWSAGMSQYVADNPETGLCESSFTINPIIPGDYMHVPQEMAPVTYRCVISNDYGSVTSSPVGFSIGSAVDILTQPWSRPATAGYSATFSVTATGWSSLTYQWQRRAAVSTTWMNLTDGANYSGTSTATLTVNPVTTAMNGDSFQCVVVDNGYGEETSSPAELTVGNAVPITGQPSTQSTTGGGSATFTVTATGVPPLTYQWQRQTAGSTTWTNLTDGGSYSGTSTATLTVNPATEAMNRDAFQCLASNGFGSATSASAVLVVTNAVTITVQPSSQSTGTGGNATFTVTASGAPTLLYQWQCEAAGTTTWTNLADATSYSGSATATLTVRSVTTAMSGDLFQCVVSNSFGSATSSAVALVVPVPLTVTTLAGQGGHSGAGDGAGSSAQFFGPADVAVDTVGNVYVADTDNHTVRKITPAGTVSPLAGYAGIGGSVDGTGAGARFNHPSGVAIDGTGNVFVADTDNYTIRRITSAGVVTTLAGQASVRGTADGTATVARFNGPSGLALDATGNLYVADTLNHTLRKITPAGAVATLAGVAGTAGTTDGTGTAARFFGLQGLAVDSGGNLYVADTNNQTIRKIVLSTGAVTTVAGLAGISGSTDAPGSMARFFYPSAVTVDGAGNLYVADTDNDIIRQITPAGVVSTIAGQAGASGSVDGGGNAARFNYPSGIAADNSGNLYIADTDNQTVRVGYSLSAPTITTQPQSQTVTAGANVQFSVTASGKPAPTYQWYFNGTAISGATNSSFSLTSTQLTNAGDYTVTVSNASGSVTSSKATLTVNSPAPPLSSSSGGGGGAPSLWFYGALSLLVAIRRWKGHVR